MSAQPRFKHLCGCLHNQTCYDCLGLIFQLSFTCKLEVCTTSRAGENWDEEERWQLGQKDGNWSAVIFLSMEPYGAVFPLFSAVVQLFMVDRPE